MDTVTQASSPPGRSCVITPPPCSCGCGNPRTRRSDGRGWTGAHGYRPACYERWRLAGKPPASEQQRRERISAGLTRWHATHGQSEAARTASAQAAANRIQDYAWLMSFGESGEQAAKRVGVTARHARLVYGPAIAAMDAAERGVAA